MEDNFYRAFEDRYRGSREDIKKRLEVYLPFLLPLYEHYPKSPVLDIGCGRGEWLELMEEHGIEAKGVDVDDEMLKAAKERGFNVEKSEGIDFLKDIPNESLLAVTAFHMVEHIPFERVRMLISEAHRVLVPGGLLILETPNPENFQVAAENFYLDPSHIKPVPSLLLAFATEFYGFKRNKTLRLQESKELFARQDATLREVMVGASPDYSVVAQKDASEEILSLCDTPFFKEYGLSRAELEARFEAKITHLYAEIERLKREDNGCFKKIASKIKRAVLALSRSS